MFGLFKKKKQEAVPQLIDIDGNTISPGDKVEVLRYDMGLSTVVYDDNTFYYRSDRTQEQVSYLKMIDAASERQKVKKIMHNN